jgi:hypothetical protein
MGGHHCAKHRGHPDCAGSAACHHLCCLMRIRHILQAKPHPPKTQHKHIEMVPPSMSSICTSNTSHTELNTDYHLCLWATSPCGRSCAQASSHWLAAQPIHSCLIIPYSRPLLLARCQLQAVCCAQAGQHGTAPSCLLHCTARLDPACRALSWLLPRSAALGWAGLMQRVSPPLQPCCWLRVNLLQLIQPLQDYLWNSSTQAGPGQCRHACSRPCRLTRLQVWLIQEVYACCKALVSCVGISTSGPHSSRDGTSCIEVHVVARLMLYGL